MWFSIGHPLLWPLASACLGRLNGRYHSSAGDAMVPYLTAEKNEYGNHITNGSHRATWAKRLCPSIRFGISRATEDSHCTCPWSGVVIQPPFSPSTVRCQSGQRCLQIDGEHAPQGLRIATGPPDLGRPGTAISRLLPAWMAQLFGN
ncbi:hypothetical protein LZ31DRAFT_324284 [Colletotrichum somersetense]|nr:hypothetical protein LZ31DRAFT_324284 [Colletotrichum somersetense]